MQAPWTRNNRRPIFSLRRDFRSAVLSNRVASIRSEERRIFHPGFVIVSTGDFGDRHPSLEINKSYFVWKIVQNYRSLDPTLHGIKKVTVLETLTLVTLFSQISVTRSCTRNSYSKIFFKFLYKFQTLSIQSLTEQLSRSDIYSDNFTSF